MKWVKCCFSPRVRLDGVAKRGSGHDQEVELRNGSDKKRTSKGKLYELEDVFSPHLQARHTNARWIPSTETLLVLEGKTLLKYNVVTKKKTNVVAVGAIAHMGRSFDLISATLSHDLKWVLIAGDVKKIWRHSFLAKYFVYNTVSKQSTPLTNSTAQFALWSPADLLVAFVCDCNIYIKDVVSGRETAVTKDGEAGNIINGVLDWVYEEEIFATNSAMWWSPDGQYLAYLRIDESNVPQDSLLHFGGGDYTGQKRYKYPKAGFPNPTVRVYIYCIQTRKVKEVPLGKDIDNYVCNVTWFDSESVSVRVMNRPQNKLTLIVADAKSGSAKTIRTDSYGQWVDDTHYPVTLLEGTNCFAQISVRDGFNHISLHNHDGHFVRFLTGGPWEVTTMCGYSQTFNLVYFIATRESPLERHLYSVSLEEPHHVTLLSTPTHSWYSATFSSSCQHFLLHGQGPHPIETTLRCSSAPDIVLLTLEDNNLVREKLKEYNLGRRENVRIPCRRVQSDAPDGAFLNAQFLYPPHFDTHKSYPVIFHVYGGPGSQTVTSEFKLGFDQCVSSMGYIVVSVDGRGTGGRGERFKKCVYRELGVREAEDVIEAAKYTASLPYVDRDRMGIWGWSYGGYLTIMVLSHPQANGLFDVGMAVAPVTDWRFYDTAYTERYLGTPQDNPDGYDKARALSRCGDLSSSLLLIHGMEDDNVHFQHSAELSRALVKKGLPHQSKFYPNENHSLNGEGVRRDMYGALLQFLRSHHL